MKNKKVEEVEEEVEAKVEEEVEAKVEEEEEYIEHRNEMYFFLKSIQNTEYRR